MQDELKDIDPEIVQAVLNHADDFVAVDTRVEEIITWGEQELKKREQSLMASGDGVIAFKESAAEIGKLVDEKLQSLKEEVQSKFSTKQEE